MEVNIFVIIVIIISIFAGFFVGFMFHRIYNKKIEKTILKNAQEVLKGERKNTITIEGKEYDATKFIVRDKENNEKIIDLKGGGITKNGKTKERSKQGSREEVKDSFSIRKNSPSVRKKKRDIGAVLYRRLRTFG